MSLKSNAFANYLGNSYNLVVAILIYPLFLSYVGAEPYGLISIFIMLQAVFMLLDMGLSPTLNRQAADSCARPERKVAFHQLLRSIELLLFVPFVFLLIIFFLIPAGWLVQWMQLETLSVDTASSCLRIMLVISLFRVLASIYRSAILGFEKQVWFNIVNVTLVTFKYPVSLLAFHFLDMDIVEFFIYQLVIAVVEVTWLSIGCYYFAAFQTKIGFVFNFQSLKDVLPFVGGVAYTSFIWILVTQFDKAILSGILPLAEFGYFGLISLVASSLIQLSGPINQAILPRLTAFFVLNKMESFFDLYLMSCRFMLAVLGSVALVMAMYPGELLYAWTGDPVLAEWGGSVLRWYILGFLMLSIGAVQYVLQFAKGNLRLHVYGSTLGVLIQLPLIYLAAVHYGAIGVAVAWFSFRVGFLLLWSPIVHYSFTPTLHISWCLSLAKVAAVLSLSAVFWWLMDLQLFSQSRTLIFLQLMGIGGITLILVILTNFKPSHFLKRYLRDGN